MKWCKECNCEYEDHVMVCADCGEPLVDSSHKPKTKTQENRDKSKTVLLTKVDQDLQATIIIELLEQNGIGAYQQTLSHTAYLGSPQNLRGVKIYVLECDLQKAQEILEQNAMAYTIQKQTLRDPELEKAEREYKEQREKK